MNPERNGRSAAASRSLSEREDARKSARPTEATGRHTDDGRILPTRPVKFDPLTKKFVALDAGALVRDPLFSNVTYEGFSSKELAFAQSAWRALLAAAGKATRYGSIENEESLRWFGVLSKPQLLTLGTNLGNMLAALLRHPITLVHDYDGVVIQEADGERFAVLAAARVYVPLAPGGYRVYLYRHSRVRDSDQHAFIRVVYHELTHKHLQTDDVYFQHDYCYTPSTTQDLAFHDPALALTNADNYGLMVASLTVNKTHSNYGDSRQAMIESRRPSAPPEPAPKARRPYIVLLNDLFWETSLNYGAACAQARKECDPTTIYDLDSSDLAGMRDWLPGGSRAGPP